jgi:hypothetical protein
MLFAELNVAAHHFIVDETKVVGFVDVLKFMMQIATSVVFFSKWLTPMYISLGIF